MQLQMLSAIGSNLDKSKILSPSNGFIAENKDLKGAITYKNRPRAPV